MSDTTPKCPRCDGEMQFGYIPDRSAGWYEPTKWFAGDLIIGFLGGIKISKTRPLLVKTYRCLRCGYLESYAREP